MKTSILSRKKTLTLLAILIVLLSVVSYFSSKQPALVVVSSEPVDKGTQNPFVPIKIYFNRVPKEKEVSFVISPETKTTIRSADNNSVFIIPEISFLSEAEYQITVTTNPPHVFSFTTEQTGSNTPGWNDAVDKADKEYEALYGQQDSALSEIRLNVPIKQAAFVVNYSYTNNTYTISLSAPYEKSKVAFLDWIKTRGVTDLSKIRIKYVNL